MNAPVMETPSVNEPKTPSRVEVDSNGVAWTIPPQGGRLKRTNDHGAHRPKKEVREKVLKAFDKHGVAWAQRVMENDKIPDEHPIKAQAANLLARYGLGTEDKVEVAKPEELALTLAETLRELGFDSGQIAQVAELFASKQGIR